MNEQNSSDLEYEVSQLDLLLTQWANSHRLSEVQSEGIYRNLTEQFQEEPRLDSYSWWRRLFRRRNQAFSPLPANFATCFAPMSARVNSEINFLAGT